MSKIDSKNSYISLEKEINKYLEKKKKSQEKIETEERVKDIKFYLKQEVNNLHSIEESSLEEEKLDYFYKKTCLQESNDIEESIDLLDILINEKVLILDKLKKLPRVQIRKAGKIILKIRD